MDNASIIRLNIWQFATIYLLLFVVLIVMKKCKIGQSKLLVVASMRMTAQLVLAGFILTYIFQNPHPAFTAGYVILMTGFAIFMALRRNKQANLNGKFKQIIGISLAASGLLVLCFFIMVVVGVDLFNPQYTIPISGMIMGNALTGVALGVKTFSQSIKDNRLQVTTLLNMGVHPRKILAPPVSRAVETALLPTLNNMLGMGIISLPGMMTGQMLSGTLPTVAIMYQIAIIIAISAVTCLSVFCALYFGARTLYNERLQM